MFFTKLFEKRMLDKAKERSKQEMLKANLIKDASFEVIDTTTDMRSRYCPIKQSNCPGTEEGCIFFQPGYVGKYYEGDSEFGVSPFVSMWLPRCKLEVE